MLKFLSNTTSDIGNPSSNSNNTPSKPRHRGSDLQTNKSEYGKKVVSDKIKDFS
jgi:hypothetical protein